MSRPFLQKTLRAFVAVLGLCTFLGAIDTAYWAFELFAHFLVQYILLALVLLPFVLWCRQWRGVLIVLLVLAINGQEMWQIAKVYSQPRVKCDGPTISVLQSNVYYRNWMIGDAAQELQKAAALADIVIFNEFSEQWRAREEGSFKKQFPHGYITWIKGNIEKMAIFSRVPFTVQQRSGRVENNAHLRLLFPTLGLTLFTYHGFTPISERWVAERDYEILRIARDMERMHSPGVLVGDFNQTPYATNFQKALKAGDLHLAPFPRGIRPTWPDSWLTAFFEIPIDHLLSNANVRVCKRKVINVPGSDHGAVLNVLQLLPDAPNFGKLEREARENGDKG